MALRRARGKKAKVGVGALFPRATLNAFVLHYQEMMDY
jgi:hypothetical protein